MESVLVADLGGTKCRFGLLTQNSTLIAVRTVPTPNRTEDFLDLLAGQFLELVAARPAELRAPTAVGIGTAGVVHPDGRVIDYAPNLPLQPRHPLAEQLEARVELPVTLVNDGRASAIGEYRQGFAVGADPLLALFFGTGIGIGLVVDGSPYGGAHNAAGEVGHTVHIPNGRSCVCGRRGCYEAYCGGGTMATRAAEELGPREGGWRIQDLLDLEDRDPKAAAILADCRQAAVAMVASLCTLLNPAAVVLGGGVIAGWPQLAEHIERGTRDWVSPIVARDLRFVPSKGGSDAILWGAAAAAGFEFA